MNATTLVAIISAATAICGGLLAWSQAVKTARLKAETDLALEQFKAEMERRRKAFDVASQQSPPLEDALSQAWADIQIVKEEIARLIGPSIHHLDLSLDAISPPTARLSEGYARWGGVAPERTRKLWHSVKNTTMSIEARLRKAHLMNRSSTALSGTDREALSRDRAMLTEYQMQLAEDRRELRKAFIQRILTEL